jgi:hypothetical protein
LPRARPSAKLPVGPTKSSALLALVGAFLYLLVAVVSASAAMVVLDPSRFPRFRPARVVLGMLFAALAFVVLTRLHYVSSGDFSLIATVAFLTGLIVDALIGDAIRAGMQRPS